MVFEQPGRNVSFTLAGETISWFRAVLSDADRKSVCLRSKPLLLRNGNEI